MRLGVLHANPGNALDQAVATVDSRTILGDLGRGQPCAQLLNLALQRRRSITSAGEFFSRRHSLRASTEAINRPGPQLTHAEPH